VFTLEAERPDDGPVIEALLNRAFGADRKTKISYRYREGVAPLAPLSRVARGADALLGSIRYWPIRVGPRHGPALLLGPVAVEPVLKGQGIGKALIRATLADAAQLGHSLVFLVGDTAYYGQFGFMPAARFGFVMPEEQPHRLHVIELAGRPIAEHAGELLPAVAADRRVA
jgi:predicted N-acetyltransferase YhbS